MHDPELIDMRAERIPAEWRRKYAARSLEHLPIDVSKAFDAIWQLQRQLDQMNTRLLLTERNIGRLWLACGLTSLLLGLGGFVVLRFLA